MDKTIIVAVATYLLGIFSRTAAPLIADRVQLFLARRAAAWRWGLGIRSRLGGGWHHTWYAEGSSDWPNENQCFVTLNAVGRHVAGVYTYQNRNWYVYGSLHADRVVTGTWGEIGPGGYRGTWIGQVDLNFKKITGWYLGTSNREPAVGAGEWLWWRQGHDEPPLPKYLVQVAPRKKKREAKT